jgi:hypothetical protein
MSKIQLNAMQVNDGDPITSELMSAIVTNINLINSMVTSAPGDLPGSPQIIEAGTTKVECKTDNSGEKPIVFTKKFATRPHVVCTVWHTSSKTPTNLKYVPTVTDSTATGFTILMQNFGSKDSGTLNVQWIATTK